MSSKKMRIVFLASGNGGTMKFVHQAVDVLNIDAEVSLVLSDRDCGAIKYAVVNNIPNVIFNPWRERTEDIVSEIKRYNPDIVVTNIHKILPSEIFKCCNAKFINLHYSLLPAFGGVIGFKTLEMAKEVNSKIIGATCHYVTEVLDGGKIISQAAMPVDWNDDFTVIGDKVFRIACEAILNGILIVSGKEESKSEHSNNVIYSPQLRYNNKLFSELFWTKIKNL